MINYKWLDNLIEEITNNEITLSNHLLKIKILAHRVKNDRLKKWIDNELNGYSENVPSYRCIDTMLVGYLVSRFHEQPNHIIDTSQISDKDLEFQLTHTNLTLPLSELENIVESNKDQKIIQSDVIGNYLIKELSYKSIWHFNQVWKLLQVRVVKGIISSIKNKLLDFLLELADEIVTENDKNIMDNKKQVDELVDRTFGSFTAETINISIEDSSIKTINNGNNSTIATIQQKGINQIHLVENYKNDIQEIIQFLKENRKEFNLPNHATTDIQILEEEISSESPNKGRINFALDSLKSGLISIGANLTTPKVQEGLDLIKKVFDNITY